MKLIINCHDLKVVEIQVAIKLGFSQTIICITTFQSGLKFGTWNLKPETLNLEP